MRLHLLSSVACVAATAMVVAPVMAATLSADYVLGSGSQLLTANGGSGSTLFFDGAALGGSDVNGTGTSFYSVLLDGGGFWNIGDTVSITGFALPIIATASNAGTFTFDIRQGAGGTGAAGTVGLNSLGMPTASFAADGANSPHFVNFDTPVTFVADSNSTSIVINWGSTATFRWKKEDSPGADRLPQINWGNGNFVGGNHGVRVSVAGSVVAVPEPASLSLVALGVVSVIAAGRRNLGRLC